MSHPERVFRVPQLARPLLSLSDIVVIVLLAVVLYLGVNMAVNTPSEVRGPDISLKITVLPYYALLSMRRMLAAYILSLVFSIIYGYTAARNPLAERWLMPLLDVLQSVPVLSFLPVVLLALLSILPQGLAIELAAIILIFTSQVWNLTFSFYQSLTTLPIEMREAAAVFRFNRWLRFKVVEMPFAALGLIWNSVMSWAGGWFFLMAAEIFTLGDRDFRLPGLGAYLQTAASKGDSRALSLGVGTLVLIIVALDQLVWKPLLAWAERFKVSQVEADNPPTSWFLDSLKNSHLAKMVIHRLISPVWTWLDCRLNRPPHEIPYLEAIETNTKNSWLSLVMAGGLVVATGYGIFEAGRLLSTLPGNAWADIAIGALATLARVGTAVTIALLWTVPLGVLIGTNTQAATLLQPVVQILASIPATALFPILLLGLLDVWGGTNIAAILLMLLGTQWYLLFNIIAGASAIPQDLKYTSDLMQLHGWRRWRTLILPALFPYIITGLITASGGAWNASIVAEYTHFGGRTSHVTGLGALITGSTADGNYALLLASTLTMIVLVVLVNRLIWRRLFKVAESRFRMDQ
jgi:NitT/TauT family transport system permease protein